MPTDPTILCLQVAAELYESERYAHSEAICRQILASQATNTAAMRQLGMSAHMQGRSDEARSFLKKAAEIEPTNPTNWQRLGELQIMEGEYGEAIISWQRVAVLSPKDANARSILGWILNSEGRRDEAEQQYRGALEINPNLPLAHVGISDMQSERGELKEAEASIRAALRTDPGFVRALGRLAVLLRNKLPQAELEALERRVAAPGLTKEDRRFGLFGLVSVLDARGDYARAAQCAEQANAIRFTRNIARPASQDNHEAVVDITISLFNRDFFNRVAGGGNPSRRPVFVFGLPRSGTSLVEQILSSHPAVLGGGEMTVTNDAIALARSLGRKAPSDGPLEYVRRLDAPAISAMAEKYLAGLHAVDGGQYQRVVDKMLHNYLYLGFLSAMFPNAAFINCRRDVRDVAVSCWMTYLAHIDWSAEKSAIALHIRQYCRLMDHWHALLPGRIFDVDYESVVEDLEGNTRKLLAVCGLEWDEKCLEFYHTKRSVRTASVAQVRQPIYKRSLERWRHYERELGDLFSQLPKMPTK